MRSFAFKLELIASWRASGRGVGSAGERQGARLVGTEKVLPVGRRPSGIAQRSVRTNCVAIDNALQHSSFDEPALVGARCSRRRSQSRKNKE